MADQSFWQWAATAMVGLVSAGSIENNRRARKRHDDLTEKVSDIKSHVDRNMVPRPELTEMHRELMHEIKETRNDIKEVHKRIDNTR